MANLDPNILRQLQELYAQQQAQAQSGSGYNPLSTSIPRIDTPEGQSYWATFSRPGAMGEAGYDTPMEQGSYIGWNTADLDNKQSTGAQYGKDGSYEGIARYKQDKTTQTLLAALAAAGGIYGLGTMMGGAGASSEAANTLLSSTEFGAPGGMMGPPTAAQWGTGASAFEQGLSPYLSSSLMGPVTQGAADAAAKGLESQLAPYLKAAAPSALQKLLNNEKGLLGPAATAIGALAGSQKQGETESTRKLDPRMDAMVFGDGGLFSRVNGLLSAQDPERDAQREQLRRAGKGLLSIDPAANGFNRYYGGR